LIHLDGSHREEALRAAFDSAVDRIYGKFKLDLSDCDVLPVVVGGVMAGAIVARGPVLHACILPEFKGRWFTRDVLRFLWSVISEHGYAQTTAATQEGRDFVARLGFRPDGDVYILR
jgi:ribosomal protein S18 acetylase RimI-like enzyme